MHYLLRWDANWNHFAIPSPLEIKLQQVLEQHIEFVYDMPWHENQFTEPPTFFRSRPLIDVTIHQGEGKQIGSIKWADLKSNIEDLRQVTKEIQHAIKDGLCNSDETRKIMERSPNIWVTHMTGNRVAISFATIKVGNTLKSVYSPIDIDYDWSSMYAEWKRQIIPTRIADILHEKAVHTHEQFNECRVLRERCRVQNRVELITGRWRMHMCPMKGKLIATSEQRPSKAQRFT